MTRHATRPAPAHTAARAVLPGLVLALMTGLVWMHALSGGHHAAAAPIHGHGGSVASAEPCGGHDRPSDCPPDQPEYPGPLCQSAAVPAATVLAAPGPGLAVPISPLLPAPVSAATVAGDAGAGSGCGPPSLTLLSISRT